MDTPGHRAGPVSYTHLDVYKRQVQTGERLAVIEAMKMENILTATRDGTVKELLAAKGESLAVDQPILSFA